jgi:hypothetical protein
MRDLVNEVVSSAQHTAGRIGSQWQAVNWPVTDIISVSNMVRAAHGEYWAAAQYVVPPEIEGHFHWELRHCADGAWREYPPR